VPGTIEGCRWVTDRAFSVAAASTWNSLPPSYCCVNALFIPPSAENSSIYCVFPVISVTLSICQLVVVSDCVKWLCSRL